MQVLQEKVTGEAAGLLLMQHFKLPRAREYLDLLAREVFLGPRWPGLLLQGPLLRLLLDTASQIDCLPQTYIKGLQVWFPLSCAGQAHELLFDWGESSAGCAE